MRQQGFFDNIINEFDAALRTVITPQRRSCSRANPGNPHSENALNSREKKDVAGLMRVNHTGEVCAQALYQGQAITAKLAHVREQMQKAAEEEVDHLAWCEKRLQELESRPSLLNPLWYSGSFMLGLIAGLAGDKWSLGFVAETERQVTAHLQQHLQKIPHKDLKTKAILTQMEEDEAHHAHTAHLAGAAELPELIKYLMSRVSKLMTASSYYI